MVLSEVSRFENTLGGVYMSLQQNDSTIFEAIKNEQKRQLQTLELIASENFVSEDVLEAYGKCDDK